MFRGSTELLCVSSSDLSSSDVLGGTEDEDGDIAVDINEMAEYRLEGPVGGKMYVENGHSPTHLTSLVFASSPYSLEDAFNGPFQQPSSPVGTTPWPSLASAQPRRKR